MIVRRALLLVALLAMAACGAGSPGAPTLRPQVLGELPHDTSAFTEGLEVAGGSLYESTGLAGRSQLRELDPATGALRRAVPLPADYFGEGLTVVGDRIWQLTWRDGVALEWDRASLQLLRQVPISGEGWGLCSDGARLVRSDGTDLLRFQDPTTFAETGSVRVTVDGEPLPQINELECVAGQVWANVWQTDRIVRIDPATGVVTAVVDASGLLSAAQRPGTDVLNGIASLGGDEFLLTGKFWPVMFRVRFTAS
ncbi:glutamine cyclotransferase [Pseudonocardia dioxanivorans CB1190]|uniref:Glutamine cyclotransferase n=1 Tax=Pseudonocardia dioxanivorans (strain ATCC 55486 / DSM 44775 / JCM 13855 / CB1190) TaxID=675635 RepID=F4CZV0_PSEUX|nr:glutamine cyclotransferase [Pseudonocardia dioxanivorans CB1190]